MSQEPKDRRKKGKLIFGALLLVIVGIVYLVQIREPKLSDDWSPTISAGIKKAKENGVDRIMVFVTNKHLSSRGETMLKRVIGSPRTQAVLEVLKYPKVRLVLQDHPELAKQNNWPEPPFAILMDLQGNQVRQTDFVQDVTFCEGFLGLSYVDAKEQLDQK